MHTYIHRIYIAICESALSCARNISFASSLKATVVEVEDSGGCDDALDHSFELLMCWVLIEVVVSLFKIPESEHEGVLHNARSLSQRKPAKQQPIFMLCPPLGTFQTYF